jgi:hypothetical protein
MGRQKPREVIMKPMPSVAAIGIALVMAAAIGAGSLVLAASETDAQVRTGARHSPHRPADGYVQRQAPSSTEPYESYSQGRQSYPNPDREYYVQHWGS